MLIKNSVKHLASLFTCCSLAVLPWSVIADDAAVQQESRLTTELLVKRVIAESSQIIYAGLQKKITAEKVDYEKGIYQTELFSDVKYSDAKVQRSAQERISTSMASFNKDTLNESNTTLNVGLRQLLTTGGEATLSYNAAEKNNNIIPSSADASVRESEFTTAINLQLKQPLLQGLNNVEVKSRIRRAELEVNIVDAQYQQQQLQLVSQALSLYWQLYKAVQFLEIRNLAVINGEKMVTDIEKRVKSGKEPDSALIDAKSELLKRRVARANASQAQNEISYQISTLMNTDAGNLGLVRYVLESKPNREAFQLTESFDDYYQRVLSIWPNVKVLQQNIAIQDEEIRVAKDSSLPKLDLELGYSFNDLSESYQGSNVFDRDHPSWYVGLSFSIPLGQNKRANAQKVMAILKQDQHKEDLRAVEIGLKNDLRARLFQVNTAYQEMSTLEDNIAILEDLYASEIRKFNVGYGKVKDIYQREDSLNLERQRLIDSLVHYELAKVSLALADGSLLSNKQLLSSQ